MDNYIEIITVLLFIPYPLHAPIKYFEFKPGVFVCAPFLLVCAAIPFVYATFVKFAHLNTAVVSKSMPLFCKLFASYCKSIFRICKYKLSL